MLRLKWHRHRTVAGTLYKIIVRNSCSACSLQSTCNVGSLGWLRIMYHRQGNKWVAKMIVGLCQGQKTTLQTLSVTFDTAHCYSRKMFVWKFNFSVHKAAQTAQCCIVKDCRGNRLSWYTAVNTTVFWVWGVIKNIKNTDYVWILLHWRTFDQVMSECRSCLVFLTCRSLLF